MRKSFAIVSILILFLLLGTSFPSLPQFRVAATQSPTVSNATVNSGSTSLTLPSGGQIYIFGFTTGGGQQATPFATGQVDSVTNTAGYLVAALAMTTSDSNSYTTGSAYPTIGGVSVSGFSSIPTPYYGSNNAPAALSTSATNVNVAQSGSLVVVVAIGGDEQCIQVSGLPGFAIDASNSNTAGLPNAITIGHATPATGLYTVTETTQQCAAGQTPDYASDLIGVFVFTPTITSTTTTVNCSPSTVSEGSATTCTATVTGASPTGTVTFSSSSGTGSFTPSNAQCTLSSGGCSVQYSDTKDGVPTITATYTGDANNERSFGITTIIISVLVTFEEGGLPQGQVWWVKLNGVTKSSTTNTISYQVLDGSYDYSILPVTACYSPTYGFNPSPVSSTFTVKGANINVPILFGTANPLWAGYLVSVNFCNRQGGVLSISGSWTVPSVPDSSAQCVITTLSEQCPSVAQWIGLGCFYSVDDCVQIGTESLYSQNLGKDIYYAWYQATITNRVTPAANITPLCTLINAGTLVFPDTLLAALAANAIGIYACALNQTPLIRLRVSPGDQITASISRSSFGLLTINMVDSTTGKGIASFHPLITVAFLGSAEAVVARTTNLASTPLPLADFGSSSFTDVSANLGGGAIGPFGALNYTPIEISGSSPSSYLAVPTSITTGTGSFTVDWQGSS